MSLETGSRIPDLVPTNPVGATDFVSAGDDHIRLIKACIQGSFPSLGSTAVSLTGAQINDAALKSATQTVSGAWTFSAAPTMAGTNISALNASNLSSGTVPDARFPATLPAASGANLTALNATNLASGTVADGRLSSNVPLKNAANTFTAGQTLQAASQPLYVQATTANCYLRLGNSVDTNGYIGYESGKMSFWTANAERVSISSAGAASVAAPSSGNALTVNGLSNEFALLVNGGATTGQSQGVFIASGTNSSDYAFWCRNKANDTSYFFVRGDGAIYAPMILSSTSTTLVKGQIHHITGNATLPALAAGEWCCVVNNSGSAITITKGGTTAYWTAAGVSVSTVTLAARGRLVVSGAGSSVDYISGDITGYT